MVLWQDDDSDRKLTMHGRVIAIALSLSYHRTITSLCHHTIVITLSRHRIIVIALSHQWVIALLSSDYRFIVIALSHYRRKRRWCDGLMVNYMALSGFYTSSTWPYALQTVELLVVILLPNNSLISEYFSLSLSPRDNMSAFSRFSYAISSNKTYLLYIKTIKPVSTINQIKAVLQLK